MRILIVTPAPPRSRKGNRITAVRWAGLLRELGHRVTIAESFDQQPCDVLIALHARKSARSIARFHRERPRLPIVLALTGTDLYRDIHRNASARQSLELASRLVLLQPHGIGELPPELRPKARVIYQSAPKSRRLPRPLENVFEVCLIGHLRPVKDPFRAALAARRLPASSRIRIVHLGSALSPKMERRARAEMAVNPRYRWLGELSYGKTQQRLARSRLLVVSSKIEGGANVICEALAAGVPVLASRISGSIGLLGEDYPGYFAAGDTDGLKRLLVQTETDVKFYGKLKEYCRRQAPLVEPARERESWKKLLAECRPYRSA